MEFYSATNTNAQKYKICCSKSVLTPKIVINMGIDTVRTLRQNFKSVGVLVRESHQPGGYQPGPDFSLQRPYTIVQQPAASLGPHIIFSVSIPVLCMVLTNE